MTDEELRLAEQIRRVLVERALTAFEDASIQGLCCEGAWEAALSALRHPDLAALLEQLQRCAADGESADPCGR